LSLKQIKSNENILREINTLKSLAIRANAET